jgi:hypothetical protein
VGGRIAPPPPSVQTEGERRGIELRQINPVAAELNGEWQAVHADLIGVNRCVAEGVSARGAAPVLALCRLLVRAGHDPSRPLHAYRGNMLSVIVGSIGNGARFTVEDDRHGRPRLRGWRDRDGGCGAGPPVRQNCSEASDPAPNLPKPLVDVLERDQAPREKVRAALARIPRPAQ